MWASGVKVSLPTYSRKWFIKIYYKIPVIEILSCLSLLPFYYEIKFRFSNRNIIMGRMSIPITIPLTITRIIIIIWLLQEIKINIRSFPKFAKRIYEYPKILLKKKQIFSQSKLNSFSPQLSIIFILLPVVTSVNIETSKKIFNQLIDYLFFN